MAEGLLAADFDHLGGGIDGDDFPGALGEQQSEGSFAGAEIGDDHGRHQAEQGLGHALPGLAGNVIFAEAAGHASQRKRASCPGAFWTTRRMAAVLCGFGNLLLRLGEQAGQRLPSGGGEFVEIALAGAAVFDQAGLLELGEVGGDGALAHDQDLLQLGDGESSPLQKQQNAEAVGVGDDAESF